MITDKESKEKKSGEMVEKNAPASQGESETIKPDKRYCACGKATISPNSPLCASCMAKKSAASRKVKTQKKDSKVKAKKKASARKGARKPKELKTASSDAAVLVEFEGHEDLFNRIKDEAFDQIRTPAGQIIWILKNSYSSHPEKGGRP